MMMEDLNRPEPPPSDPDLSEVPIKEFIEGLDEKYDLGLSPQQITTVVATLTEEQLFNYAGEMQAAVHDRRSLQIMELPSQLITAILKAFAKWRRTRNDRKRAPPSTPVLMSPSSLGLSISINQPSFAEPPPAPSSSPAARLIPSSTASPAPTPWAHPTPSASPSQIQIQSQIQSQSQSQCQSQSQSQCQCQSPSASL
mmetsp:Transcript_32127/g.78259  ORF Transcript_32127/g.78259 Transcript_32127/m.78259 type:complete len:198 (-) Transcript_32127:144-737(-)